MVYITICQDDLLPFVHKKWQFFYAIGLLIEYFYETFIKQICFGVTCGERADLLVLVCEV